VPAEVCAACSDIPSGRLVPTSFCRTLRAEGRTAEYSTPEEDELWRVRYAGMNEAVVPEHPMRGNDES